MTKIKSILPCLVMLFFLIPNGSASEWTQLHGVLHVQTTFDGTGAYSLSELVSMARNKGIDVLVPADHDLQVMSYGLPPFRNLIKKTEVRGSVLQRGPEKFLSEINQVNRIQQEVIVIPGVQSSPFYYWTGNPLFGTLTAHDYRKELLIVGLRSAGDYRGLPLLHNGFSTRYVKPLIPQSLFFLMALLVSAYLVRQKGILRIVGYVIGIFSLLLLVDQHPFQSSRFDPYHGDAGIAPFQEVIDYVNQRGAMCFWMHPESNYAVKGVEQGPVRLVTAHYPDVLSESTGYAGFEAVYGDTITATDPGRHWDQVLTAYCRSSRGRPAWGIAGADFHGNRKGELIDEFQTVFLVRKKAREEVIEALSRGRMYALRKGPASGLVLKRFVVRNRETGDEATMGQSLNATDPPMVDIEVDSDDGQPHAVTIRLIRNGEVIKSVRGKTPRTVLFQVPLPRNGLSYYRLEARGKTAGYLLSNPIFVKNSSGDDR